MLESLPAWCAANRLHSPKVHCLNGLTADILPSEAVDLMRDIVSGVRSDATSSSGGGIAGHLSARRVGSGRQQPPAVDRECDLRTVAEATASSVITPSRGVQSDSAVETCVQSMQSSDQSTVRSASTVLSKQSTLRAGAGRTQSAAVTTVGKPTTATTASVFDFDGDEEETHCGDSESPSRRSVARGVRSSENCGSVRARLFPSDASTPERRGTSPSDSSHRSAGSKLQRRSPSPAGARPTGKAGSAIALALSRTVQAIASARASASPAAVDTCVGAAAPRAASGKGRGAASTFKQTLLQFQKAPSASASHSQMESAASGQAFEGRHLPPLHIVIVDELDGLMSRGHRGRETIYS